MMKKIMILGLLLLVVGCTSNRGTRYIDCTHCYQEATITIYNNSDNSYSFTTDGKELINISVLCPSDFYFNQPCVEDELSKFENYIIINTDVHERVCECIEY